VGSCYYTPKILSLPLVSHKTKPNKPGGQKRCSRMSAKTKQTKAKQKNELELDLFFELDLETPDIREIGTGNITHEIDTWKEEVQNAVIFPLNSKKFIFENEDEIFAG